jgi:hypothetical protein
VATRPSWWPTRRYRFGDEEEFHQSRHSIQRKRYFSHTHFLFSLLFPYGFSLFLPGLNEAAGPGNECECELIMWTDNQKETRELSEENGNGEKREGESDRKSGRENVSDKETSKEEESISDEARDHEGEKEKEREEGDKETEREEREERKSSKEEKDESSKSGAGDHRATSSSLSKVTWHSFVWRRGTIPIHWHIDLKAHVAEPGSLPLSLDFPLFLSLSLSLSLFPINQFLTT